MKVRIVVRPSGLLNGVEWPEEGKTIDLPDAVAKGMVESGDVEAVKAEKKVEKRPASQAGVEKRKA